MGVQPSRSPDFYDRYQISQGTCLPRSKPPAAGCKYIASILQLTSEVDYTHLQTLTSHKLHSSSGYITKLHDRLQGQNIKICSKYQRMTLIYQQSGINLVQMLQSRRRTRRPFNEEDAVYLIECVVRGLNQFKRMGDSSQILTTSCIILDVDNRYKVVDPFLIASDPFSQDRTYLKQVQYIYGLQNKYSHEDIRKQELKFKYLVCQTEEKKVDGFYTSLFALACICLSILNFDFKLENYFVPKYSQNNKQLQFNWAKYRTLLKPIRSQNLRQKLWLLTSQYHNERAQVFQFLDARFEDSNYPVEQLIKSTTIWHGSNQVVRDESHKLSLANYMGPLKQSITIMPAPSISLQIKQSDVRKQLTTFSSTNNSQLHTQTIPSHDYCQTSNINQNYFNLAFHQQNMMKRSLPVNIMSSPYPTFTYNLRPTVQTSQIIHVAAQQHPQQFYRIQPPVTTITPNNNRYSSASQILNQKSLINHLLEDHIKMPANQKLTESSKKIKKLEDLQQDEHESIHAEVQEQSEHSQNVQRVDINEVFPGYKQPLNYVEEQLSPIHHVQTFQQPPLHEILINGVIQEDSAQNSLSQQSEVQNQSEFVIEEYTNGGRYEGYKQNQMRQGYGKLYFSNGQIYDGQWKNNKMHGYGKLYYDENTLVYEGRWKEDSFHGLGKLFNLDIQPMKTACDFLNFSTNCNSWKKYEGQFNQDTKEGEGRLTFQNDQYYEGEFKADKISGHGLFVGKNGFRTNGEWNDWKLVKIY